MKKYIMILLLSTNVTAGAILKDGVCPTGYHQSGAYCLGNSVNVGNAIEKAGICPSGYYQSGAYCKENR